MGDYDVELRVRSNDPDEQLTVSEVRGSGSEAAIYEQVVVQPDIQAVDVLWVIDNSGSMSSLVDHLGSRFSTFLDAFDATGIDYQVGVTTTDIPADGGRLQGPIIKSSDADPVAEFVAQTALGAAGSANEQGRDAAYLALTEPNISGTNAGLVRADANLAIVVLSDEDDSSDLVGKSQFITWLNGYKGDPARTSFSGITGDPDAGLFDFGCGIFGVSATSAKNYGDVIDGTGGVWQDICEDDFDEVLDYLAYGASGLLFTFKLDRWPTSPAGVEVYVDGIKQVHGWSGSYLYSPSDNSITFNNGFIPGPGAQIEIRYPIDGDC
jgi:hypothetical protein